MQEGRSSCTPSEKIELAKWAEEAGLKTSGVARSPETVVLKRESKALIILLRGMRLESSREKAGSLENSCGYTIIGKY